MLNVQNSHMSIESIKSIYMASVSKETENSRPICKCTPSGHNN